MNYITYTDSPIGPITLSSDGESITGLWMENQKYYGSRLKGDEREQDLPLFAETKLWLNDYFGGKKPKGLPPLAAEGTEFQKEVWKILLSIPYGELTTYGAIAKEVGKSRGLAKMSAQPVGSAVGRNPISILIPCHRVVGANGSLTGYAGGIDKKIFLLKLENSFSGKLFVPKKSTAM